MGHLVQPILDFISAHSGWAVAIMFATAFGESFAFVSLLFPGTSLLIAAGALVAAGSLPYFPIMAGAIIGAVLGDTVSFWIGHRFGGGIARIWPFTRSPELLPSGIRFFAKHGGKSVFIGRFFGPVRAVIPLAVEPADRSPPASCECRAAAFGLPMSHPRWFGRRCSSSQATLLATSATDSSDPRAPRC